MTASTTLADPVSPPSAGEGFAARRLYRLMTLSLAITTLIELASVLPVAIAQAAVLGVDYTAFAMTLIVAPSVLALFVFSWMPLTRLRWVWRAQAAGMMLVYAAIPVALSGAHLVADTPLTWTMELEVIAGCAAALGWRLRGAVAYAALLQLVLFGVVLFCTEDGAAGGLAFGDAIRQLFYVAMFMSLCAAMLRAGRILDDTVDRAVDEVHASAAAERRRTARHRLAMLVHDSIIVALLAYASGADRERSAAEAEAALAAIEAGPQNRAEAARTPRALAWELQGLTTRLDPEIRFEYSAADGGEIPAGVCTAISEAYAEAVRNSLRHAVGADAISRQVRAAIGADRVDLSILDDGSGFTLSEVGPARLGIRHGIIGRMHGVPGGSATVHSSHGYGTTVLLQWRRP